MAATPEMFEVLQIIKREPTVDKTTLGNLIGTSRTAVSRIIGELENEHIITTSSDGRTILADYGYTLGIAVGTRHIRAVLMDTNNELVSLPVQEKEGLFVLSRNRMKRDLLNKGKTENEIAKIGETILFDLESRSFEEFAQFLNLLIEDVLDIVENKKSFQILGIGIAFQGTVNRKDQEIMFSPNVKALEGKRVKELIYRNNWKMLKTHNIPIVVDNTAKAALTAEREFLYKATDEDHLKLRNKPNVGLVYMGTGISFASTFDGNIARGASNYFGELGHIRFPRVGGENNTIICSCNKQNCLEALLREEVFHAQSLSQYWDVTHDTSLEVFSSEHPAEYEKLKKYLGYIMNILVDMLNLDGLLFTGRLFACIPDIENELDTIMGENTNTITCRDCTTMKGAKRTNTAACGMAMEAFALYFGMPDLSWPDIEKARNVGR